MKHKYNTVFIFYNICTVNSNFFILRLANKFVKLADLILKIFIKYGDYGSTVER